MCIGIIDTASCTRRGCGRMEHPGPDHNLPHRRGSVSLAVSSARPSHSGRGGARGECTGVRGVSRSGFGPSSSAAAAAEPQLACRASAPTPQLMRPRLASRLRQWGQSKIPCCFRRYSSECVLSRSRLGRMSAVRSCTRSLIVLSDPISSEQYEY
eukprot:SAG31_NODE_1378_length_8588_cov_2.424382_2_plen_155_part_00